MSLLHAACRCCMSVQRVHTACSCFISMLHALAAFPC
jgi:hypothetical protein